MSREALSLEISQVVSRVVSGEPIDAAERGTHLAQKYPGLGMSGEMIGEAIRRAAGMVGMIRKTPMPAAWPQDPVPNAAGAATTMNGSGNGARTAPSLPPYVGPVIGDDLAAAIEEEIGILVSGRVAQVSRRTNGGTHAKAVMAAFSARPMAALRRAFFGH
jgi:hypothetical protein